ncbi:MAG: GAF domain-containing protein [Anaerolineales bacterium]
MSAHEPSAVPEDIRLRVVVIADVETNATQLVDRILKPAGFEAWPATDDAPEADVLVVDVTQIRGDPMAGLRNRREMGDDAPALVLAAHFPASRLRGFLQLGVRDVLLKPYREEELHEAINALGKARKGEGGTGELTRTVESLQEDLRRRTDEIRMLSGIGRVVASLDDLDEILAHLVEAAAYVTDAEEASIYLADAETDEVVLRATKQAGERQATLQRLRADDMLVGQVFRTGQPILRKPRMDSGPVKVQTGFMVQSVVKVPIRLRQEVAGVLGVYNRLALRSFNEHHVTLLMTLADWAGVALDRAALVQQASANMSGTGPISLASPSLVEGLDEAIATLESYVDGQNALGQGKSELLKVQDQLKELRTLPISTLEPEAAEELVDLARLIQRAAADHQLQAARRGLSLTVESEAPVPLFPGDSERVYQVIDALVAAAIRRTMTGRVMLQIQFFEAGNGESDEVLLPAGLELASGHWAAVIVADSSTGLPPETVKALTAPTADPSAGNLGYGLSLGELRMIAESMGGLLWYDQTPASAKITLALPIGS